MRSYDVHSCTISYRRRPIRQQDRTRRIAAAIARQQLSRLLDDVRRVEQPVIIEKSGVRFGFMQRTSIFWPRGQAAGPLSPGVATLAAHTAYHLGAIRQILAAVKG